MSEIIKWIIVSVIALLIVSFIVEPSTRQEIRNFFSDAVKSVEKGIQKIPTSDGKSCEEWAKDEIIPSKAQIIQAQSENAKMFDGSYLGGKIAVFGGYCGVTYSKTPLVRKGSNSGENVNNYYLQSGLFHEDFLEYGKQIISEDGLIKGSDYVKYKYVLKCQENGKICLQQSGGHDPDMEYLVRDCEVVEKIVLECKKVS